MLHITMGAERQTDPAVDELSRTRAGFAEDMTDKQLYEASRGCWILGARADTEKYYLTSYAGTVRLAVEIENLVNVYTGRRAIEGHILQAGDPVYDAYVGKPSPVGKVRNPVTYFDAVVGRRLCRCGCGAEVPKGYFLPGHDQRALHERIARIGTVADFCDWFDAINPA